MSSVSDAKGLVLRVPSTCVSCQKSGAIRLHTVSEEGSLELFWDCVLCDHKWPVMLSDVKAARIR